MIKGGLLSSENRSSRNSSSQTSKCHDLYAHPFLNDCHYTDTDYLQLSQALHDELINNDVLGKEYIIASLWAKVIPIDLPNKDCFQSETSMKDRVFGHTCYLP